MASTNTQGQRHDRIGILQPPSEHKHPPAPNYNPPKNRVDGEISVVQRMLSATIGSVLTSLLVTPLDVVRVRLQATGPVSQPNAAKLPPFLELPPNLGITACCREVFWVQNQSQFCVASPAPTIENSASIASDCAAEETQRRTFNSTLDGLRKIARNEGILTLWRGLSPTLAMAIPANVIYFAGYDWLRFSHKSPMYGKVSDQYAPLAAGSIARILAAIAVGPIEMLRTRMQATHSNEGGVMRATMIGLKEMGASEGYHSLWRGLSLTLWRDVPFSALYWWGYETGRNRLNTMRARANVHGNETPHLTKTQLLTDSFLAGAGSGAVAALVTTPFDVGKTRQQTVLHGPEAKITGLLKDLPENRTMPRFLWHIYCTEGMTGLFKGWAARCLKVAPACAIMISSYEIGKRLAAKRNEKKDVLEG